MHLPNDGKSNILDSSKTKQADADLTGMISYCERYSGKGGIRQPIATLQHDPLAQLLIIPAGRTLCQPIFISDKELYMFKLLKRFLREEDGQDFAEYALILGAIGVVAIAVIARYRNELQAAFEAGIEALRMARGG
jgi:Flp pilus assembly pilin Flp